MKEYRWEGRTVNDTLKEGEANSRDEGVEFALAAGCLTYTIARNAGYDPEVHGRETQVLPGAATDLQLEDDVEGAMDAGKAVLQTGQTQDLQGKTDLQVLAQANATLFRQVGELKDALHAKELENGTLAGQLRESDQKVEQLLAQNGDLCQQMQDAKAAALAWFTEYQTGTVDPAVEPAFMALIRAF